MSTQFVIQKQLTKKMTMEEEMTNMVEVKAVEIEAVSKVAVKVEVEVDLTILTTRKKTTSTSIAQ